MEYATKTGTVYIVSDPNGLYALVDGAKVTSDGLNITDDTEASMILPTYKWEVDNSGNWTTTEYKCTAKYTEFEGRHYERTVYTAAQTVDPGGKITRDVRTRPTDSDEGEEVLTAT